MLLLLYTMEQLLQHRFWCCLEHFPFHLPGDVTSLSVCFYSNEDGKAWMCMVLVVAYPCLIHYGHVIMMQCLDSIAPPKFTWPLNLSSFLIWSQHLPFTWSNRSGAAVRRGKNGAFLVPNLRLFWRTSDKQCRLRLLTTPTHLSRSRHSYWTYLHSPRANYF